MSVAPDAPRTGWDKGLARVTGFVGATLAIAEVEWHKLRRDPTELVTRSVQPALWLLVFGQVMGRLHGIPTGGVSYLAFMAPGILAQSVMFIAIFYGIVIIWERDLGLLQKQLVTPASRAALVLGKGLSAGIRGTAQAVIVYTLTILAGVPVNYSPLAIAGVLAMVVLSAMLFSTFSLVIACLMKTRERFMGIGQVLTMPLFFASNAIYPIAMMPGWLQRVAEVNPLSFQVDALRALMLRGGFSHFGLAADFAVQLVVLTVLVVLAARLYPKVAE